MNVSTSVTAAGSYAGIYRIGAAELGKGRAAATVADENTSPGSSTVSISSAAREAARNDAGRRLSLPDAEYWMCKDFPADIMAEAQTRLAERQAAPGVGNGYLPDSVANLPLLPENQALLEQFRQEMREIGHDNTDPQKNARFNRLLNLSLRVQIEGWKAPMTEADAQRELDISQAMGVLSANQPAPETAPAADANPDFMAGWKLRWAQEGLEMPAVETKDVLDAAPGQSLWLQLADKAGIGQGEFVDKARELAGQFRGNALTRVIEQFISERYLAFKAAGEGAKAA